MLLISLAFADTPIAAKAAAGLVRDARAMRPPETWLDADAWTWGAERPIVATILAGTADAAKTGPVRALANDPAARARKAKEATEADVHATVECTIAAGTKMWAASPAVPPETQPWWPGRAQLLRVAVVPLLCPPATPYVGVALTETDGVGWRIAAFVGKDELTKWYGIAEEAGHDLVAERALARAESRRAVKLPVVSRWEPPSLARIPWLDRDLDGDGFQEVFGRYPEIYWSATATITSPDMAKGRGYLVADQDGDRRTELLVGYADRAEVWPGGDAARAWRLQEVPAKVQAWTAGDLDGDGRGDIVALADAYAVVWFGGASTPTARIELPTLATDVDVTGDLDGDGLGDLMFYDPEYDGQRGVGMFVHGARAGGRPRTAAFVGEPGDRAGESGSYADLEGDGKIELLHQRWDGVARRSAIEVLSGEGEILPNPLPPELLGDSCDYERATDLGGDRRAELVAWCGRELRIWSPETGTRHVSLPPGTGPGRLVVTRDGPAITIPTRTELLLLPLRATSVDAAVRIPRPADAKWTLGASDRGITPAVLRDNPMPAPIPVRAGRAVYCIVRASVSGDGSLLDYTYANCPDEARATVAAAMPTAVWYPLENTRGPVLFDLRFIFAD